MELIKLSCQNCNAQLEIDLDNLQAFCPFCGQKLLFDLKQMELVLAAKEKTKREQEKTKREQEITKRVQEKTKQVQIKHEFKEREAKRENRSPLIYFGLMMIMLLLAFQYLDYSQKTDIEKHLSNNEIRARTDSKDFKGIDVEDAKKLLTSAGFENIKLEASEDLIIGLFKKNGQVESVSINGNSSFLGSAWFPKSAYVIIKYHTFKPKE